MERRRKQHLLKLSPLIGVAMSLYKEFTLLLVYNYYYAGLNIVIKVCSQLLYLWFSIVEAEMQNMFHCLHIRNWWWEEGDRWWASSLKIKIWPILCS